MSDYLKCKFCGGYVKYIKHKESYLDQEGYVVESDIDENQYFKCTSCGTKKYLLEDLANVIEEE